MGEGIQWEGIKITSKKVAITLEVLQVTLPDRVGRIQ